MSHNPKYTSLYSLRTINHYIQHRRTKALLPHGITPSQSDVLQFLFRNQDRTVYQRDIESALLLSNPTVTGIVKRLEAKKLVKRLTSLSDARYREIICTPKGLSLYQIIADGMDHAEADLRSDMNDEEYDLFCVLLKKAADSMEKKNTEFSES